MRPVHEPLAVFPRVATGYSYTLSRRSAGRVLDKHREGPGPGSWRNVGRAANNGAEAATLERL